MSFNVCACMYVCVLRVCVLHVCVCVCVRARVCVLCTCLHVWMFMTCTHAGILSMLQQYRHQECVFELTVIQAQKQSIIIIIV